MSNRIVEELLAAYSELRPFLAYRLANPHDTADVAHSSFERVYTHGLAATITAPRALLFRTAQRICIDAARHREIAAILPVSTGRAAPSAGASDIAGSRLSGKST